MKGHSLASGDVLQGAFLSLALGKPCPHHPSVHDGCPQGGAGCRVPRHSLFLHWLGSCLCGSQVWDLLARASPQTAYCSWLSPVSSGPNLRHPGPHHSHSQQASPWKSNGQVWEGGCQHLQAPMLGQSECQSSPQPFCCILPKDAGKGCASPASQRSLHNPLTTFPSPSQNTGPYRSSLLA